MPQAITSRSHVVACRCRPLLHLIDCARVHPHERSPAIPEGHRFRAGMLFTGCSLLDSRLRAQQSGVRQRRQVMAGGRRISTIDIHAHVIVPEATALMGVKTAPTTRR